MPEENTANAGSGSQTTQPSGDAGTVAPKTFTQADVDRINAETRREYEHKAKDWKDKAKAYDEFIAKQKEKEHAEMSELEKLKLSISELNPWVDKAKQYESAVLEMLDAKIASIPEDKRMLIETLPASATPLDKLKWIDAAFASGIFGNDKEAIGAPAGGKLGGKQSDPLMEKAIAAVKRVRPNLRPDSKEFEAAVQRAYEEAKLMAGSAQSPAWSQSITG